MCLFTKKAERMNIRKGLSLECEAAKALGRGDSSQLRINYVSGLPGLGKTHWLVQKLIKEFLDSSTRDSYLTVYVAPTIKLLKQFRHDLLSSKQLTEQQQERLASRIYLVDSTSGGRSSVTQTLEVIIKGGTTSNGNLLYPLAKGSIVLVTHKLFVDTPEFPNSKQFRVFFDEARNCITQESKIILSKEEITELFRRFTIERIKPTNPFVKVIDAPSPNDARSFITALKSRKGHNWDSLVSILQKIANPRQDVYLVAIGEFNPSKPMAFYSIVLPTKIFEGFREVTVMSAFFKDSQMYHLLERYSDHRLVLKDITSEVINYAPTRVRKLFGRLNDLIIAPLVKSPVEYRWDSGTKMERLHSDMLTSQHLTRDFLVPKQLSLKLTSLLASLNYGYKPYNLRKANELLTEGKHYEVPKLQSAVLRKVMSADEDNEIEWNPLLWYAKSALEVINSWPFLNRRSPPLAVINKAVGQSYFTRIPEAVKSAIPEFRYISSKSNGMNCYIESNAMAFLGAFNPTPDLISFYREILPNYDFSKDGVIDICIQSLGRLAIRDADSNTPVLLVVATSDIAWQIKDKFGLEGKGIKISSAAIDHYDYTSFRYTPKEGTLVAHNRLYNPDDVKEVHRLTVRKSRLNQQLAEAKVKKDATKRRELEAKLKAVEKQILALRSN